MKQIAILSGKGGTGKTTITASIAMLLGDCVLADCDVDAPDLHLIIKPDVLEEEPFSGLKLAHIDERTCTRCGACRDACAFGAISDDIKLDPMSCEGCSVCRLVCPVGAITMSPRDSGQLFVSRTRAGTMVHALLNIAEEASGKLVSKVREKARRICEKEGKAYVVIDGPPGVGCPVIATLGGVDLVLLVTEPTVSGIHDMDRMVATARFFDIPVAVCINKHDVVPENTAKLEKYCKGNGIDVVGKIPHDPEVVRSMVDGKTVVETSDGPASKAIKEMVPRLVKALDGRGGEHRSGTKER